ncbi:hypothetical protein CHUAL_009556 [Chamberlinius hualienensis]
MEIEEKKEEIDPRSKVLFVDGYKTTVKSFENNRESENPDAYIANIEVIFSNEDDVKVWLEKLQRQLGIKYAIKNSRKAQPRSRLAVYSILICNRNTRRKTEYFNKISRPHTGCPSKMSLKVSKPTYFVKDFVGNIIINNDHNHAVGDVDDSSKSKESPKKPKKSIKPKSPKKKIIAEPCVENIADYVYEFIEVSPYEESDLKENEIAVSSNSTKISLVSSEITKF